MDRRALSSESSKAAWPLTQEATDAVQVTETGRGGDKVSQRKNWHKLTTSYVGGGERVDCEG